MYLFAENNLSYGVATYGMQHKVFACFLPSRLLVLLGLASIIPAVLREAEMQNPCQQSPFRKPLSAGSEEIPHCLLRVW